MRSLFRSSIVALILLGAAITAPMGRAQTLAEQIILTRSGGCLGGCASYRVSVTANGHVHFQGGDTTATTSASGWIAAATYAELAAAARAADLGSLRRKYTDRGVGCDTLLEDQPTLNLAFVDRGADHSVVFYEGCQGAEADAVRLRLLPLAELIDRRVDSLRWIGQPAASGESLR